MPYRIVTRGLLAGIIVSSLVAAAGCASLDPSPSYEDTYDQAQGRGFRPSQNTGGTALFRDIRSARSVTAL